MPRRPAAYLTVALACAAVGALVYAIAVGTRWGAELDSVVLGGFTGLERPWLDTPAAALVRLVDPWPYALLGAALATVALARSRPRHALVVAGVLGGAALTSQLLKPLLAAPRPFEGIAGAGLGDASWPSGHTTGAMALALCLVLVAPRRLRPLAAACAAAFAVGLPFALLLLESHFPSDVLGGYCVACAWMALGLAALRATDARGAAAPAPARAVLVPTAVVALLGAAIVAAAVLARPASAFSYAQDNTAFVAAAAALGAAGLVAVASAALALRREP